MQVITTDENDAPHFMTDTKVSYKRLNLSGQWRQPEKRQALALAGGLKIEARAGF